MSSGIRRFWKKSYEYKRILEILDDYWLTERNEFSVRVTMDFIRYDGSTQTKSIIWHNPFIKELIPKENKNNVKTK